MNSSSLEEIEEKFLEKMSWKERQALIEQAFPSTVELSWDKALKADVGFFGEVLRGILKYDQEGQGRPGPRSISSRDEGVVRLAQFMGEDHSLSPMPETLKALKGDLSIRKLAAKSGVDYNIVFQLLHGRTAPTLPVMESLAKAFDKHPSYFLEYRTQYIVACLLHQMKEWPEASVSVYRKIKMGEYA